jgi:hypothetical protein
MHKNSWKKLTTEVDRRCAKDQKSAAAAAARRTALVEPLNRFSCLKVQKPLIGPRRCFWGLIDKSWLKG